MFGPVQGNALPKQNTTVMVFESPDVPKAAVPLAVTPCPALAANELMLKVVARMVWVKTADVDVVKLVSPLYTAVIE